MARLPPATVVPATRAVKPPNNAASEADDSLARQAVDSERDKRDICLGAAPWYANLLCCPCVLPFNAIALYLVPCCSALAWQCLVQGCCFLCINGYCNACESFWRFQDGAFPHNESSIGPKQSAAATPVVFARSDAIFAKLEIGKDRQKKVRHMLLFDGPIAPADIAQGGLGDCWLMSASACLAEYDGAIHKLFLTKCWSYNGKYSLRLFRATTNAWERIDLDDFFPVDSQGLPLYARPNGPELWMMLLEKAFAKFMGSYSALDGGFMCYALQAMTGDKVYRLVRDPHQSSWIGERILPWDPRQGGGLRFVKASTAALLSSAATFSLLLQLHARRACLAASISSTGGEDRSTFKAEGLVAGHAYSILAVASIQGFQLLQLRNPWGKFEWKGEWSDGSKLWDQHPRIRQQLRPKGPVDDGVFWIAYPDFARLYNNIDVCDRTVDVTDLAADLREADGACGPTVGCVVGCADYWCCCTGCSLLYCARHTSQGLEDAAAVAESSPAAGAAPDAAATPVTDASSFDALSFALPRPVLAPPSAPPDYVSPSPSIPPIPVLRTPWRRLLLISSLTASPVAIAAAAGPGTLAVLFSWESFSLADVLGAARLALCHVDPQLESVGLLSVGKPGAMNIVQAGRTTLGTLRRPGLREFWAQLAALTAAGGRLDLGASALASDPDGRPLATYLTRLTGRSVTATDVLSPRGAIVTPRPGLPWVGAGGYLDPVLSAADMAGEWQGRGEQHSTRDACMH